MRKIWVIWLCTLLIFSSTIIVTNWSEDTEGKAVVDGSITANSVHNVDTDEYFLTIQGAIDDPETLNGHTIEVSIGIYNETVVVDKRLTLIGEDRNTTIIDAQGSGDVIFINADGVEITGFNLTGSGNFGAPNYDSGIELNNVQSCYIFDVISWENRYGVKLTSSLSNTIENCISKNYFNGNGIRFDSSHGNFIISSNFSFNDDWGIRLISSNNNTINGNTVQNNGNGIIVFDSNNNQVYHNNFINSLGPHAQDNTGTNSWDDGYPSGGNYWNDYSGTDNFIGPNQDIPGSDGIGDAPYTDILGGTGAQDNYPLMDPWGQATETDVIIQLWHGWNLLSLPLVQSDESIGVALSSIDGKWDYIQAYDPLSPDPWKTNATFKPASLNDLHALNHTVGFWIHIVETTPVEVVNETHWNAFEDEPPIILEHGNIINCTLYLFIPGDDVFILVEGVDYFLDYENGIVDTSPIEPWDVGWIFYAFYNYSTPLNLTVTGSIPGSTNILLHSGWNLVGYPSLVEKSISDALAGTGYDRVEGFNATAPYRINQLADSYMMKPGEGYWVHVPADSIWTIDW